MRDAKWRGWMQCAQAGDRLAYEQLLGELTHYARKKVAYEVTDVGAREDIVQNALLSVHRARHTYRSGHQFEPWFNTILKHAVIDWFRARNRRQALETSFEEGRFAEPITLPREAGDALSPELAEALASLPPKHREAVELIHLEGLTVIEAAARAGVTPGALKVRAHRGYRALRKILPRQR